MIADMRPDIYFVFEQPAGSCGFKQTFMLSLMASLNMLLNLYTPSDKFFFHFSPALSWHSCTHVSIVSSLSYPHLWQRKVMRLYMDGHVWARFAQMYPPSDEPQAHLI